MPEEIGQLVRLKALCLAGRRNLRSLPTALWSLSRTPARWLLLQAHRPRLYLWATVRSFRLFRSGLRPFLSTLCVHTFVLFRLLSFVVAVSSLPFTSDTFLYAVICYSIVPRFAQQVLPCCDAGGADVARRLYRSDGDEHFQQCE